MNFDEGCVLVARQRPPVHVQHHRAIFGLIPLGHFEPPCILSDLTPSDAIKEMTGEFFEEDIIKFFNTLVFK